MKHISSFQIHNTFMMAGHGIVLVGEILGKDVFLTGDFIEFEFKDQNVRRKIIGIDNRNLVENGKPNIGVLIETRDEQEVSHLQSWNPELTVGEIYSSRLGN